MAAPDDKRALAALQTVQSLSGEELDALIASEVGNEMLGVMKAVARAQFPDDDDATRARHVHLLLFGYLLRREVTR